MKINDTPVRTSRNFRINNLKLENIQIPSNLDTFKNVEIITQKAEISNNVRKYKLEYGNGEILEENAQNEANSVLNIKTSRKGEKVTIIYTFTDEETILVNNIEINTYKDADITIVYKSKTDKPCFHNSVIRLNTSPEDKVNVNIVNMLNNNSMHFESMESSLEDNTNLKYTIIDLGGKVSATNYFADIIGKEAKNDLKTIYLGIENQIKDINYIAHLKGEKTEGYIDVQGVLNDEAKKNFKGTLDFKRGCKGAKGDENEFCMLLSPKAKSIALPMLLCTEDDVEGNHSTASGKVDEKSLFYIMSRGLNEKEAIKLIVRARFNKILERIKDEELLKDIVHEIDNRL
ncbi:MAG: SufD family Fe-S cluster assembly protein [Clostridia bacterium]|nr:SufD family Fe-S cluster assembly protein [Clostridia bacterium]